MQAKLFLLVIAFPLFSWPASADKLDEFKDAASKAGCDSIPYRLSRSDLV